MPTSTSSATVHPWMTAECPTVTREPMLTECSSPAWTTQLSWMLLWSPTVMVATSARSTAP